MTLHLLLRVAQRTLLRPIGRVMRQETQSQCRRSAMIHMSGGAQPLRTVSSGIAENCVEVFWGTVRVDGVEIKVM